MNRWMVLIAALTLAIVGAMGCSGSGVSPVTPDSGPGLTGQTEYGVEGNTVLWGYYDLYFDFANGTVEAVANRGAMFTANVVTFVNNPASNLGFAINGTPVGADYIDVDIDVSITHPFPGLNQYDGYDVRGVFIGAGSETLEYGNGLIYPAFGTDQMMYDYDLTDADPYDGLVGNPDGYTRWFNAPEFPAAGVLGYTVGRLATPNYTANLTATLNAYKYFCDDLEADADLWTFLNDPGYTGNGVFTAGAVNTRNYYLRFPNPTPGVKYGYAIVASWEDPADPNFPPPNNCLEAVTCLVEDDSDLWWESASDNGGNLTADISIFGWDMMPSTVTIESTVLSAPYTWDTSAVSTVGGGDLYSTWSVDLAADNLTTNTSAGGMDEFWVICEYSGYDYGSIFSPTGTYPEEPLAAFFRYDLYVADEQGCSDPMPTGIDFDPPNGVTAPGVGAFTGVEITGTGFDGATATVEFRATSGDYIATNVTSNGVDTITCDIDFTGATFGEDLDLYIMNECGNDYTAAAFTNIAFPIHPYAGATPGGGPVTLTSSQSYPEAIDICARPSDGGAYAMWYGGYANSGYIERYDPTLTTILGSGDMYIANPILPADVTYGKAMCDCNVGGVGAINLAWHWYGPDDFSTWAGTGYAQYQPDYPGDCVSSGDGACTSYHAFGMFGPIYRSYLTRPSWTAASPMLVTGSSDFDGTFSDEILRMAAGDTDSNLWALSSTSATVGGHVFNYSDGTWAALGGTYFGATGTGDGEFTNPRDITMSDTDNRIFVLDEPTTGMTRIQAFDTTGTLLASSGEYDASANGGSAPYALDYNEFEGVLYVLYDNNTCEVWIDETQ